MSAAATVSLLVKQPGSALAEVLHRGLCAAGLKVAVVPTPYDVVAAAEQAGTALRYLILGIDFFGREEFRLLPLVRREWPKTVIVVYHSDGFGYKARIAELVGADIALATCDDVARFVESLAPSPAPPVPDAAVDTPGRPAAWPAEAPPPDEPAATAPGLGEPAEPAAEPPLATEVASPADPSRAFQDLVAAVAAATQSGKTRDLHPEPPAADDPLEELVEDKELENGRVLGTVELTDEELRMLLSEDEEE